MNVSPAEVEQALERLAATPRRIRSQSRNLPDERLAARAGPQAWSANDVLAHLRACADVWGKSIGIMLEQDHPTLRYLSPRTWVRKTDYPTQRFGQSLQAFASQRAELLKTLGALDLADWSRGATFTGTVRGREPTVLSYARRIADHEQEHSEQLDALLK